jgi:hypothetical protein
MIPLFTSFFKAKAEEMKALESQKILLEERLSVSKVGVFGG